MEFIEAPAFTRFVEAYLTDSELRALQISLLDHPESGDVMQGTGGFREYRWRDPTRCKGKRGGLRVIYYYLPKTIRSGSSPCTARTRSSI